MPRMTVDYSEGQLVILKTCRPRIFVPEMDIYLNSAVVIKRLCTHDLGRFDLEMPEFGVDSGGISRWIFDKDCVNEEKSVLIQLLLA